MSVTRPSVSSTTTTRATVCSFERSTENDIESGIYGYDESAVAQLGTLAQDAPKDPSPPAVSGPPFTNVQASLIYGAATFELGVLFTPFNHFVAGTFPATDINNIRPGWSIPTWRAGTRSSAPPAPSSPRRSSETPTPSPATRGRPAPSTTTVRM